MQIVILAGGLGTRLGSKTKDIPKSLVEIEGKPFIEYQFDLLRKHNFTNIILCVGHLHEQIRDYCKTVKDLHIQFSLDDGYGTWDALRNAEAFLENKFMVMYGDSYLKINFNEFKRYCSQHYGFPLIVTMCKCKNNNGNIYKAKLGHFYYNQNIHGNLIDYGLLCLDKQLLYNIPLDVDKLPDVLTMLSFNNQIAGYIVDHTFYEIGSVEGLEDFSNYIRGLNDNK